MNIYLDRGFYKIYPNLYVIIIADSGKLRKSTAVEYGVDQLLRHVPGVKLFVERMTMEGLLDQMDQVTFSNGIVQRSGEVFVFAPELIMFLPGDEISKKVIGFLTSVYMGKEKYGYLTKGGGEVKLENVLITFLGATAPDWLETISEDAAKGGFLARIVFITAEKRKKAIAWPQPNATSARLEDLRDDLIGISNLRGQMIPTQAFKDTFEKWYIKEDPPHDDPRVQGFREREHDLVIRVAMLLSIAASNSLVVDVEHLQNARTIVKDVEDFVPKALSHIATSPHARDAERVLGQIKRRGGTMSHTDMARANSWKLSKTELEEIVRTLENRAEIHMVRQGRAMIYKLGPKP